MYRLKEKLIQMIDSPDITKKSCIYCENILHEITFINKEIGSRDSEEFEEIKYIFKLISSNNIYKAEFLLSREIISGELQYGDISNQLLLSLWKN